MDLSSVVVALASGTYTVTRSGPTTFTDGRRDAATTSTFDITASVQPVSGRDLLRLPEGMRTRELLNVFTPTELLTQGSGQEPDSLEIGDDSYEVQRVERWADLGNYYKVTVARIGR